MPTKTDAVISFLQTCPTILNNPLFFNFGNVEDNAHQIITKSDETSLQKPYIDGSVLKRYTVSIDSFKSIAYNPIIVEVINDTPTFTLDENSTEFAEVQALLDWINDQNDLNNYPDFGQDCIIDEMTVLTNKPEIVGVDTSLNPPMAVYRITIQIDYLDNSKKIY